MTRIARVRDAPFLERWKTRPLFIMRPSGSRQDGDIQMEALDRRAGRRAADSSPEEIRRTPLQPAHAVLRPDG
jgi:hypothetical protein